MIKNLVRIEQEISEKVFHFLCDHDADTKIIKEALCQFLKIIGQIEDQVKANEAQQQSEAPVPEQPVPDIQPVEPVQEVS